MPAYLAKLRQAVDARQRHERAVLLLILLGSLIMGWLLLVQDPLQARRQQVQAQLASASIEIQAQEQRAQQLQTAFNDDPDALARRRVDRLQAESDRVDQRLNEVYGQLVSPSSMSSILTRILQSESSLRLVNLQNQAPEEVFQSALPARGQAAAQAQQRNSERGLSVYRHQLSIVFEGSYLDTLDYLYRLEALESSFFWEALEFELLEHPRARITLRLFTLSTDEEWIGV